MAKYTEDQDPKWRRERRRQKENDERKRIDWYDDDYEEDRKSGKFRRIKKRERMD